MSHLPKCWSVVYCRLEPDGDRVMMENILREELFQAMVALCRDVLRREINIRTAGRVKYLEVLVCEHP